MRAISIGTPPLLVAGVQARLNTSTAITPGGPKIGVLDRVFAHCRALETLSFLGGFQGARVS
jgi:hypothetical protein